MRTAIHFLYAALAATAAVTAQDLTVEAPPQRHPVVILGATVHVGDGSVLEDAAVWFANGRIVGTGSKDDAPVDATRVDASGLHVWPGMVAAATRLGIQEIGSVSATFDYDEIGSLTPEVRAAVAVNPDSTTLPVTRSNGVLTAGVFPSGGALPGQASVIELAGWTWEEMALRPSAGLVVDWPAGGVRRPWQSESDYREAVQRVGGQREELAELFDDARAWAAARSADGEGVAQDIRLAAMQGALRGATPVFVQADDVDAIRSAIGWAVDEGLRMVLVGGADAEQCADLLKEHRIPVVVTGTQRTPRRRDHAYDRPFTLPARLAAAGVDFCISGTTGYYNERNLPYHAGQAVAYGLDPDRAFAAVSKDAAQILGLGDELGTLEVGKRATLIVTDGHPLEVTTQVRMAWASGRRLDLSNKQTKLAEKYRERYRQLGIWPGGPK